MQITVVFKLFSNLIPIWKTLPPNLNKGFIEPSCISVCWHAQFWSGCYSTKIILKPNLSTYFPGMKIDPNMFFFYLFVISFPSICNHGEKHFFFFKFCIKKIHCRVKKQNKNKKQHNYAFFLMRMTSTFNTSALLCLCLQTRHSTDEKKNKLTTAFTSLSNHCFIKNYLHRNESVVMLLVS